MTNKIVKPQDFATSGNYAAGADAWSGQPRKVTMTATEKAAGFTPNTPVTAERRNGLHAEHYDAASVQAISALKSWRKASMPFTDQVLSFLAPVTIPAFGAKAIVGAGYDISDGFGIFVRSYGNGEFEGTKRTDGANNAAECFAAGATGEYIASVNAGGSFIVRSHPALGTVSAVDYAFGSDQPIALWYAPFCSKYFIAQVSGYIFAVAASLGGAGSSVNVASSLQAASNGVAGGEFADDGTANIVYAGRGIVAGVDRFRIYHTSNNGTTWAVAHTAAAGVTSLNVLWSEIDGAFIALSSDGKIYSSADGAAFTLLRTTTITAANGASVRHNTLAAQGSCLVKAYNPTVYGAPASGVVYSFDQGATWRDWVISDSDSLAGAGNGIFSVIGANGCFYATDRANVYRSGYVLSGGSDY